MGDADVLGHLHRLIVFDLDGTLIDSRQDLVDSANALIVERGGRPLAAEVIARMVGEGAATLVRRALEAANLTADSASVPRFLELYGARLLDTTRPYPGIPGVLEHYLPIPNRPQLAGIDVYLQAWSPVPAANPAGIVVSNGVRLRLQPVY